MDRGYGVVLEFLMSYVALTLLAYDSIHINWFLVYIPGLESELNGYMTIGMSNNNRLWWQGLSNK